MRGLFLLLVLSLSGLAVSEELRPVKVEIQLKDGAYQLLRGGEPYVVRGAGIAVEESDTEELMHALARHGGNSFRTWHVADGAFLDLAQELGLTVALCLDVARERHGFDYGDRVAVRKQFERVRGEVLKHRNHPALLAWVIGNELNHDYSDPRVYDAVNEISRMIHALDPNHPTTSTTADISAELVRDIVERAPDLDFISVQSYGGLEALPGKLREFGVTKPVMVTEWGTIGHWEVPTTDWGAPIELSSTDKAAFYGRGANEVLPQVGGLLIGNYAFLWGQKQERTPTWYGVFVNGRVTQAVNQLQRLWTGEWPTDRAPEVISLRLDGGSAEDNIRLRAGETFEAVAHISDSEGGALSYEWRLLEESRAKQSGGDPEEVPPDLSAAISDLGQGRARLEAPVRSGAYRIFVYAQDPGGAVAHANIPFFVEGGEH